ncbi:hypothetical protein ACTFTM_11055 [Micromonospora sp. RB23]
MHPVALTCPLWWVARWATRVLTSLAVLALALGAAPASAAPASAAPASAAPASPSTIGSFALAEPLAPSTAALTTVLADRAVTGRGAPERAAEDPAAKVRADAPSARSVDPQPALHRGPDALPRPPAGVTSACTGSERPLQAAGSASRASRAPPA